MQLFDKYGRRHRYLRISLTDRCNLNCVYCNPVIDNIKKLRKNSILSFQEIIRIIRVFVVDYEFDKIRLTGGEPFARKGVMEFIKELGNLKSKFPFELTATTNGTLIDGKIKLLKEYGLDRINFSLDSLNRDNFMKITGKDKFNSVIKSIREVEALDMRKVKINCVVMKGVNDNEVFEFIEFAKEDKRNIRFIEYMPFTGNGFNDKLFISSMELRKIIESRYPLEKIDRDNSTLVSKDYRLKGSDAVISFISSISEHFCDGCDRIRITSSGKMKTCLFSNRDSDGNLMTLLRSGGADREIKSFIERQILKKDLVHPSLNELKLMRNNNMLKIGG